LFEQPGTNPELLLGLIEHKIPHGRIGLIRKGSGEVVGLADLVDAKAPLRTRKEYAATARYHCTTSPADQAEAFADCYRTPWVLAQAQKLPCPVRYKHPSGAIIWVRLAPSVQRQIVVQLR
jgi:hypothetical protein